MNALEETAKTAILDEFIAGLNLDYAVEFIPASRVPKSRKWDGEGKRPVFHWELTIAKGNNKITTPYSTGFAHQFPSTFGKTADEMAHIKEVAQKGWIYCNLKTLAGPKHRVTHPDLKDVLCSLVQDSDVLNYKDYEDWAANLGFDPDSRKGERAYRDCLASALKLRLLLGETTLSRLQELFQDY